MKKILSQIKNRKISNAQLVSLVSITLLAIGLVIVLPSLYFRWNNTGTASANPITASQVWSKVNSEAKPTTNQVKVTGFPISISIPGSRPALNIYDQVIPGYYNKNSGQWTLSGKAAQFAVISSQPNNISGNTFIYGHYNPYVFAYLHLITPGTVATITTDNGYEFSYKFVNTYTVQPTDTNVLNYSGSPILTVQTCSGAFFQNRQMFVFSFESYKKI